MSHRDATPLYDEAFKAYGYDRISQVCEMYVKGFKFYVLDNAFVMHKGFKSKDKFHQSKAQENAHVSFKMNISDIISRKKYKQIMVRIPEGSMTNYFIASSTFWREPCISD